MLSQFIGLTAYIRLQDEPLRKEDINSTSTADLTGGPLTKQCYNVTSLGHFLGLELLNTKHGNVVKKIKIRQILFGLSPEQHHMIFLDLQSCDLRLFQLLDWAQ